MIIIYAASVIAIGVMMWTGLRWLKAGDEYRAAVTDWLSELQDRVDHLEKKNTSEGNEDE